MTNDTQNVTKVTKQSKNKIRVDFERTSLWQRLKIKRFYSCWDLLWTLMRLFMVIETMWR